MLAESEPAPISENRGILRAALLLSLGNVTSRLLGLVREMVKARLFGASGLLGAFTIATYVPNSIFQLIVGGEMVNSSLVPVFSEYAHRADDPERKELWEVVTSFLSLAFFVLALCVVLIELLAQPLAMLLGADEFSDPALLETTVSLMRLAAPAVLFLSLASLISGVLYAMKRFTLPAFTAAILNGTIVVVALLHGDVSGLVWGLLLGSGLQVVVQLPALRDARFVRIDWRHPALRRILILYAPIVAGLVVNQLAIGFSYRLAAGEADEAIASMQFATTLLQFPLGLVVTALSIATLPTLSQQANGSWEAYRKTLASGLRLVLTLILPATLGLFALAIPIVALVFEWDNFTPDNTAVVALVLRFYLFGLPFAAVDQMLVFASYARQDTWRPALIGVISVAVYMVVALLLVGPLSYLCLMVADTVKHIVHTVLMIWVLGRAQGGLRGYGIGPALSKALAASLVMGVVAYFLWELLVSWLPAGLLWSKLLLVGLPGLAGLLIYLAAVFLLDMKDAHALRRQFLRR